MSQKDRGFSNSKVMITGGNGFIGSHIVKRMVREGADVAVIARESSDLWRIEAELPYINIIKCDLKDEKAIEESVYKVKPEYIFHMAAYGVDFRQQNYAEAANSNIIGTINLLESIRKSGGCRKFLYTGTSMQYGNKEGMINEETRLTPSNIYGSTKAASTLIAHQIAAENDIEIITLVPFGVFGENEGSHKFFPHIILTILNNEDVDLTLCEQYRDYCYIENIVDGFLLAALDKEHKNAIYNIGSGSIYQLKHYVDMILNITGTKQKANYGALEYRKNDLWRPQPDVSKIKKELNWEPKISLEDGMLRTVKWYTDNFEKYKYKGR